MEPDWSFMQDRHVLRLINSAANFVKTDFYPVEDAYQDLLVWAATHKHPEDEPLFRWVLIKRGQEFARRHMKREQLMTDDEWEAMGRG